MERQLEEAMNQELKVQLAAGSIRCYWN